MKEHCSIVSSDRTCNFITKVFCHDIINVLETQIKLLICVESKAGGETPMQTITEVTKLSQNNLVTSVYTLV